MPRVVSSRGDVYEVADAELPELLSNGYTLEAPEAGLARAIDAGREERYSGLGAKLDAAAVGALRGASLGMSDAFVSDDERDYVNAIKEYNPITSGVSEFAGAVAPSLLTGGAGTVASFTPAGLASRAGTAVTRGIQAGGGALRGIAGYAAGGALEGAAAGAGAYISDAALQNKDLSAEGFLGAMGQGALWGGAIGAGFGVAERGLVAARKLWPKSEVTREAVQVAEGEAQAAVARTVAAGDEAEMALRRRIQEMRAADPAADKAAREAADTYRARVAEANARAAEARAAAAEQKLTTQRKLDEIRVEKAKTGRRRPAKGTPADAPAAGLEPTPAAATDAAPTAPLAGEAPLAASVEEAMEDAMAAVNQDIAAAVRARRDYTFGKSQLPRLDGPAGASGRQWKVRGHQGDGYELLDDAQLAQSTMGRLKEALGKRGVTAEQRAAVEKLLTPKRLEALRKYEAGEVRAMPYWFNKEHVFEGKTFRISDLVDSEDIVEARRLVHGVRSDLETWTTKAGVKQADELHHFKQSGGRLTSFADAKPYVDQFGDVWDAELLHNIGVIGDFERSVHNMVQTLGDAAPAAARQHADDYARAAAGAGDATAQQVANVADQAVAARSFDDAVADLAASPQRLAAAPAPSVATPLSPAGVPPSNVTPGAAAAASSASGITDGLAAMELLSSFQDLGLPSVRNIPVIGPALSLFLKAKAAGQVFRRLGGKVPATAEAAVASRAAATRNKLQAAAGRFLEAGARGAGKAARHMPRAAALALSHQQYDDGRGRREPAGKTPVEQYRLRAAEVARALADEGQTRRRLAEQVRASDPAVAKALGDKFMAKMRFLDSKMPRDPRGASVFARADYEPSKAEVERLARFVHYADNPADVLDDLADGALTMEGVETIKTVYPELYAEAQRHVLDALAQSDGDVPYARRVRLSMLFDVVSDPTLTPQYISAMQAQAPAVPPTAPPPGTPPQPGLSGDPRRLVDSYQTAFDRRAM